MFSNDFVVIPDRPRLSTVRAVVILCVFVGGLMLSYQIGKYLAWPTQQSMHDEQKTLQNEFAHAQQLVLEYQHAIASFEEKSKVNDAARGKLQSQIVNLQDTISGLEKQLNLYQNKNIT